MSEKTKIAALREKSGLTQDEVAERTAINIRQYRKYERGESKAENIPLKNACLLAAAFGCTPEDLLEEKIILKKKQISKKRLMQKITREYKSGRDWKRIGHGRFYVMRIDVSNANMWTDCMEQNDTKIYHSPDVRRIDEDCMGGWRVSQIEKEYLEEATKILTENGWEVTE